MLIIEPASTAFDRDQQSWYLISHSSFFYSTQRRFVSVNIVKVGKMFEMDSYSNGLLSNELVRIQTDAQQTYGIGVYLCKIINEQHTRDFSSLLLLSQSTGKLPHTDNVSCEHRSNQTLTHTNRTSRSILTQTMQCDRYDGTDQSDVRSAIARSISRSVFFTFVRAHMEAYVVSSANIVPYENDLHYLCLGK